MKSVYVLPLILISITAIADRIDFSKSIVPPRKDLYQKIAEEAEISLRQVFNLVFHKQKANIKKSVVDRLSKSLKVEKGVNQIKLRLNERIKTLKSHCNRKKSDCQLHITNLESQINVLEKNQKDEKLKLYTNLLVFSDIVQNNVLRSSYLKWENQCKKNINSVRCQSLYFEIDVLFLIANRLTQSAYLLSKSEDKREGSNMSEKNEIDRLIKRYE